MGHRHVNVSEKKQNWVNDFAKPGEYVSYYLQTSFFGRETYIGKQNKPEPDLFQVKKICHELRVELRSHGNDITSNGTTIEQLNEIERYVVKSIAEMEERKMLYDIGIETEKEQSDIINSTHKKATYQLKEGIVALSKGNCIVNIDFKKGFFSNVSGIFTIIPEICKMNTLQSFYKFDSSFSQNLPKVKLELEFKPANLSDKPDYPTFIAIEPTLVIIDIQSEKHLPVVFDDFFLLHNKKEIVSYFSKFLVYLSKVIKLSKQGIPVPTPLIKTLDSLTHFVYQEIPISGLFRKQNVNLSWEYNRSFKSFRSTVEIPLEFDIKNITKHKITLLPGFQTCLFARLHKLELNITTKTGKGGVTFLPIHVV